MGEAILYQLHSLLAATALCFCRLAPTFYLLPFFASGNIPTVVRHPIIIVVSCALVQHYHYELLNAEFTIQVQQKKKYSSTRI